MLRALGWTAISSMALRFFTPQQVIRKVVLELGRGKTRQQISPERVAWSINATAQFVPQSSCLTRAIAGAALLKRTGYPAVIHFGVAVGGSKDLRAHAWVECEGKSVLGGPDPKAEFAPLAALVAD